MIGRFVRRSEPKKITHTEVLEFDEKEITEEEFNEVLFEHAEDILFTFTTFSQVTLSKEEYSKVMAALIFDWCNTREESPEGMIRRIVRELEKLKEKLTHE